MSLDKANAPASTMIFLLFSLCPITLVSTLTAISLVSHIFLEAWAKSQNIYIPALISEIPLR